MAHCKRRRGCRLPELRVQPKRRQIEEAKAKLLKIGAAVMDHIHDVELISQTKAHNYLEEVNQLKKDEECMRDLEICQVTDKLSRQMRGIIQDNNVNQHVHGAAEAKDEISTPFIIDLSEDLSILDVNELRSSQTTPDLSMNVLELSSSLSFIDINHPGISGNNYVEDAKNSKHPLTAFDTENVNPIEDISNTPRTMKIKKCLREYTINKRLEAAKPLSTVIDLNQDYDTKLLKNENMQVKTYFQAPTLNSGTKINHTCAENNAFSEIHSQSILANSNDVLPKQIFVFPGNSSDLNTILYTPKIFENIQSKADHIRKSENVGGGQNSGPLGIIVDINENIASRALKSPILLPEDLFSKAETMNSNIITKQTKSIQFSDNITILNSPNTNKDHTVKKISPIAFKKKPCYEEFTNSVNQTNIPFENQLNNLEKEIPFNTIVNPCSNNILSQNTETLYRNNIMHINKVTDLENRPIPTNNVITNLHLTNTIQNSEHLESKRDTIHIKGAIKRTRKKTTKNALKSNMNNETYTYVDNFIKNASNEVCNNNTQRNEATQPRVTSDVSVIQESDCSWVREINFIRYVEPDEYTETDLGTYWCDH